MSEEETMDAGALPEYGHDLDSGLHDAALEYVVALVVLGMVSRGR